MRLLRLLLIAGVGLVGCYSGVFMVFWGFVFEDIDGPVSLGVRVLWVGAGLIVLLPSCVLLRWAWRHRRAEVAT